MAAPNKRLLLKRLLLIMLLKRRKRRRQDKYKKDFWVRKIYQERTTKGEFHLLVQDLRLFDHFYFFQCFRMSPATYEKLLSWVGPRIQRKSTRMRDPIGASERLTLTLRYLVSGDAQVSIAASYRISPSVVGRAIKETCKVIWDTLADRGFLSPPKCMEDWRRIADAFEEKWNFPHALGAIDGKHIVIQAPARGGSDFFNYKKTHSIVLLAVCNADYQFLLVDVGDAGRQSDGSVYNNSHLGYAIDNNILNLPNPTKIGNFDGTFPYVFLADDAFGLKTYLMKPYPGQYLTEDKRIFNYRLSRGRRIIENTFGIAASRFRILRKPIIAKVDTVVQVTKAVVGLHNFLMSTRLSDDVNSYCPFNYIDQELVNGVQPGQWRNDAAPIDSFYPIARVGSNNYSKDAETTRERFENYFNSPEGEVIGQYDMVRRVANRFDE